MSEASHREKLSPAPAQSRSVWAALITVWIAWGTVYLATRIVNQSMPPLMASSSRFLVAGPILYLIAIRRRGTSAPRPTVHQWRTAAVVGTLLVSGGIGLTALAQDTIPSGLAALLIALVPLWMALFDRLLFGIRLRPVTVVGLLIGFAGAAMLVGGSLAGTVDPLGLGLVIVASLLWTLGSLYSRGANLPDDPLVTAGMEMLCGGVAGLGVALILGEARGLEPATFTWVSIVSFVYLVIVGSIVGYTCYAWLLRSAPTALVSTFAYVNPVVAVVLGSVILSEAFTARTGGAACAVVVAVILIVSGQGRPHGEPRSGGSAVQAATSRGLRAGEESNPQPSDP